MKSDEESEFQRVQKRAIKSDLFGFMVIFLFFTVFMFAAWRGHTIENHSKEVDRKALIELIDTRIQEANKKDKP